MVEISYFLYTVQSLKLLQTAEEYESHIGDDKLSALINYSPDIVSTSKRTC